MSISVIDAKALHGEAAAYAWVESRLWPNGPVCPHCGAVDRISKMGGKSTRIGVYKCYQCRKPFTVKVGTVFEASHVPMHYWPSKLHGSCLTASVKPCASLASNQWAALAKSWRLMKPSSANRKAKRRAAQAVPT